MRNFILMIGIFIISIAFVKAQDLKIGVRFTPLNSSYNMDNMINNSQGQINSDKQETRYDSLTIGFFCEKYFTKKSFLLKFDFSYADYNVASSDNSSYADTNN